MESCVRLGSRLRVFGATALTAILGGILLAPPSQAANCAITRYGKAGSYICGTKVLDLSWPDGVARTFIIGINDDVWNIVRYKNGTSSPWVSMGTGGWVGRGVFSDNHPGSYNLVIYTYSSITVMGQPFPRICDTLSSSGWSDWYDC